MQGMPPDKNDDDDETRITSMDDPRSRLISDFCFIENFSPTTYFKLHRLGFGPEELCPPQSKIRRITREAHVEWRQRMRELAQSEAGALEHERRRRQASEAGRRAAASPKHVSRREKKGAA
jgi:hypothetical protein